MDAVTATLTASITGIVVSGIVGPQVSARSARRASNAEFTRNQVSHHRDDLRSLLDDAAVLLASGATNLRAIREASTSSTPVSPAVRDWLSQVFPLGQRLRLRLPEQHEVVRAYDDVRVALAEVGEVGDDVEASIAEFENRRRVFLDLGRAAVTAPITSDGGKWI